MVRLPDYIGASAFGIKMGVIVPGSDILQIVYDSMVKCDNDGLLDSGDTICITESVVARAQNNYVTTADIAHEAQEKLGTSSTSKIGVLFPLLSRNRFSLILKGLAKAVPQGEVVVQLSYPADEVGNRLLPSDFAERLGKTDRDVITLEEIGTERLKHPITGVDYIGLYESIIREQGAKASMFLCNDPLEMARWNVDAIIVANVHNRDQVSQKLRNAGQKCITLQDMCNSEPGAWSEWGLLGSNMSSQDRLKLAPRKADELACSLQARIARELGKDVEVVVYGDGAYHDPSTGIYELADPQPAFGITKGLAGKYREGVKYKYIVDQMWEKGNRIAEIEETLKAKKTEPILRDSPEVEGTTPRRVEDVIASLADLVSGSADAGTPLVLVKGFLE